MTTKVIGNGIASFLRDFKFGKVFQDYFSCFTDNETLLPIVDQCQITASSKLSNSTSPFFAIDTVKGNTINI